MGIFEGFIHPALAWGVLLAGVPILIHLLNRRRHKPLPWAAMRFVLAAYRRTRRRVQLENLLLLLLRTAAVALLALAVARPFTGRESPLAALTETRRDLVLVLDGSASTGYRESVRSVHESIVERARSIIGELDGTRGDRVRLVWAARGPRLVSARSPEDALTLLATLSEEDDESLDLAGALAEVVTYAEEDAGSSGRSALEVRILSDLQRNTFAPSAAPTDTPAEPAAAGEPALPLVRALDRLDELGVRVVVEDLGPGALEPANMGIESIEPLAEILGAGLPTEIGVRVRNFGPSGRTAVRVALEIDGDRTPSQKVDVAAHGSAQVVFPVVFRDSGYHALTASLEGDRLAIDDARATVVHVPAPTSVLLVDGDPHDEIDKDEVGYLRAVLEPPDDSGVIASPTRVYSPFACDTIPAGALGAELDLAPYDVIVLANVGSISERVVEELEARVAAGAGLIVTLGDRSADPSALESLNARLWRADGTGLLPARLVASHTVRSRRDDYYRASWFEGEHPALAFFADERWRALFTEVPIYAFVATEEPEAAQGTRVLARLDDEDKSPLLFERDYDRGRVFLWTTSIDSDWNRIPESPKTLIPFVHELLRHAGRGVTQARTTDVGATLALELDSFPRNPTLVRPDGTRRRIDGEPTQVAENVWRLPPIGPTDAVGLWKIETESSSPIAFAVEFESAEGDLERISPAELEASHRAWKFLEEDGDDLEEAGDPPERGELWRWLAAATLVALVLETLWAAWIGRGRRLA